MKDFNEGRTPPAELTETITLGWQYDPEAQTLVLDENGQPIAATYKVKSTLSANDLINLTKLYGLEGLEHIEEKLNEDRFGTVIELVGAIYGDDLVLSLAANPTIEPAEFFEVCAWLISRLDLGAGLPADKLRELEADNPLDLPLEGSATE